MNTPKDTIHDLDVLIADSGETNSANAPIAPSMSAIEVNELFAALRKLAAIDPFAIRDLAAGLAAQSA